MLFKIHLVSVAKQRFLPVYCFWNYWLTWVFILLISEILKPSVWLPYLAEKLIPFLSVIWKLVKNRKYRNVKIEMIERTIQKVEIWV